MDWTSIAQVDLISTLQYLLCIVGLAGLHAISVGRL